MKMKVTKWGARRWALWSAIRVMLGLGPIGHYTPGGGGAYSAKELGYPNANGTLDYPQYEKEKPTAKSVDIKRKLKLVLIGVIAIWILAKILW